MIHKGSKSATMTTDHDRFCVSGIKMLMRPSFRWFHGGFPGTLALCSLPPPPHPHPLLLPLPPVFHLISSLFSPFSVFLWERSLPWPSPSALAVAQIGCDSCHVTFRAPASFSPFLFRLTPPSHRASALSARQSRGY